MMVELLILNMELEFGDGINMKGFTRDNKFVPMTDYKKVTRKSRDPEVKTIGVRMKREKSLPVSFQHRDASVKNRVNINLDVLERYYIKKDVSLAERAFAVREIKRLTGLDPRMFGNTDADVLKGIRHIRSKVNSVRKKIDQHIAERDSDLSIEKINNFQKLLGSKFFKLNSAHTVGKILGDVRLDGYSRTGLVVKVPIDTSDKSRVKEVPTWRFSNTFYAEEALTEIAKDAKESGFMKTASVDNLLKIPIDGGSEVWASNTEDGKPALIKIGKKVTYFIAPRIDSRDFEREVMKQVVKENIAEEKRLQQ